jgi:hypothetical protein
VPTVLLHIALIAIFGVILPWRKGLDFLDPVMISAYACIGMLFAPPAAAANFGGPRPQSLSQAVQRAWKAVLYGEGLAVILMLAGVITVSFSRGRVLVPQLDVLGEAALLGLAGTIALALLAGWMTLHFSIMAARTGMRVIFLLLLLGFFFRSQKLPDVSLQGAAIAVGVAAVALLLLQREVNPQ